MFDASNMARGIMDAASGSGATVEVKFDIGRWKDGDVRALMDALLAETKDYKLRVKGVRTDTSGFRKLGIDQDRSNSGLYEGVPVVITDVPFDAFEIVIEQASR